jgi:hypothetical protein
MKKLFMRLWGEEPSAKRAVCQPQTVWDRLAIEGEHSLITTLHKVEKGESGYGTLIEPDIGYSKDPVTNDLVKRWLGTQEKVLVYNVNQELAELEQALTNQEALS